MRNAHIRDQTTWLRWVMNNNEGLTIALVFRRSRISVLKLRNPKDVTMSPSHFRLKVNLSKFFHDARRICWILVDPTKIQHIIHVKQHITKIFGVREPFHLLLNDGEYLPPMEDVRLLLENDIIKVVPGSGIHNEAVLTTSATDNTGTLLVNKSDAENSKHLSKTRKSNDIVHNKIVQITDAKVDKIRGNANNRIEVSDSTLNNTMDQNLTYKSEMYVTAIDYSEADSKVTDYNDVTENSNNMDSTTKRKRVRKRKPKSSHHENGQGDSEFDSQLDMSTSDTKETNESKKPKIVNTIIIPTAKHIRFSDLEDNLVTAKEVAYEESNDIISSHTNTGTSKNLVKLLSLTKSSTPLFTKKSKDNKIESMPAPIISAIDDDSLGTIIDADFASPRRKKTVQEAAVIAADLASPIEKRARCLKNSSKTQNDNSVETNICTKDCKKSKHAYDYKILKTIQLEHFPIMTRNPCVGDIIGFKTLKLGEDYTPQESNFIIGEVLSSCAKSATYTFKIIKGLEETEVPSGKFSLDEDEEDEDSDSSCQVIDKVSFSYSQIREPRLITYGIPL